jgi:hypothetical protein
MSLSEVLPTTPEEPADDGATDEPDHGEELPQTGTGSLFSFNSLITLVLSLLG